MNGDPERSYRRWLRSYPKTWRNEHGEILLGTLLDEAEAEGWSKPPVSQRISLLVHGMAERTSLRTVIGLAALALLLSILGTGWQWAAWEAQSVPGWIGFALVAGPAAWIVVMALTGLLRVMGWIGHARSLAVNLLALPALALTVLAVFSWSHGFDEADADMPLSAFSDAFIPLLVLAFTVGSSAGAVLIDGLLANKVGNPQRKLAALVLGVVVALSVGISLAGMGSVPVAAAAALVAALWAQNQRKARTVTNRPTRNAARPVPIDRVSHDAKASTSTHVGIRLLAGLSALPGLACVAFALTGSLWTEGGPDSTRTMQIGLAGGALAGIPLLIALAIRWGKGHGAFTGPMTCMGVSLVVAAASNFYGDGSGTLVSLMPMGVAAVLASVAVGWGSAIFLAERRGNHLGPLIPFAIGLGFAVALSIAWVFMAPFVLPVVAMIVVVRTGSGPVSQPVGVNA